MAWVSRRRSGTRGGSCTHDESPRKHPPVCNTSAHYLRLVTRDSLLAIAAPYPPRPPIFHVPHSNSSHSFHCSLPPHCPAAALKRPPSEAVVLDFVAGVHVNPRQDTARARHLLAANRLLSSSRLLKNRPAPAISGLVCV